MLCRLKGLDFDVVVLIKKGWAKSEQAQIQRALVPAPLKAL
jgi:hypothetical protein